MANCGEMNASFLQLLASTLRVAADGVVYVNSIQATDAADDLSFIDCDNNHLSPEELLRFAFTNDSNGHLALVIGTSS